MYYDFLLSMWRQDRITKEKLQIFIPKGISQEQYEQIIAHPHDWKK